MRVALLSPGPSLRRTYNPAERFHLRIGINTVPRDYLCNIWCAGDPKPFEEITPLCDPVGGHGPDVCTMPANVHRFRGGDLFERFPHFRGSMAISWDELGQKIRREHSDPLPPLWDSYSAPVALVLAVWHGAREIHCYGCDMAGDVYYDGSGNAGLNPNRWAEERRLWDLITRWAGLQGVTVIRHQPSETAEVAA